jgi:hypothetical protein
MVWEVAIKAPIVALLAGIWLALVASVLVDAWRQASRPIRKEDSRCRRA